MFTESSHHIFSFFISFVHKKIYYYRLSAVFFLLPTTQRRVLNANKHLCETERQIPEWCNWKRNRWEREKKTKPVAMKNTQKSNKATITRISYYISNNNKIATDPENICYWRNGYISDYSHYGANAQKFLHRVSHIIVTYVEYELNGNSKRAHFSPQKNPVLLFRTKEYSSFLVLQIMAEERWKKKDATERIYVWIRSTFWNVYSRFVCAISLKQNASLSETSYYLCTYG